MKVDKRFHCFGCQEDGDVIDFVGKLFGLSPKRAAEKLAEDFGVRYEGLQAWQPQRRPSVISKLAAAQEYRKKEERCYRVLCGYLHLLRDWKEQYAPQPEDEDWHPLFCDIGRIGGGKDVGMDAVLSRLGIPLEQTMAFGDGENDLEMLRHAAIGVTMGNSSQTVKNAADYVTDSVDEDGIANALAHFGLI